MLLVVILAKAGDQELDEQALPPTRQLAQVDDADIGAVAVRLLEDPGRFAGKRLDLGGNELTGNEVVAILSRFQATSGAAAGMLRLSSNHRRQ